MARDGARGGATVCRAVLAVVVYNGTRSLWGRRRRWQSWWGTAHGHWRGRRLRGRGFTRENYVLVGVRAYPVERPPAGQSGVAGDGRGGDDRAGSDASDVLEEALRLLSTAEREQLRATFLSWFRLLLGRAEVDSEFLRTER